MAIRKKTFRNKKKQVKKNKSKRRVLKRNTRKMRGGECDTRNQYEIYSQEDCYGIQVDKSTLGNQFVGQYFKLIPKTITDRSYPNTYGRLDKIEGNTLFFSIVDRRNEKIKEKVVNKTSDEYTFFKLNDELKATLDEEYSRLTGRPNFMTGHYDENNSIPLEARIKERADAFNMDPDTFYNKLRKGLRL